MTNLIKVTSLDSSNKDRTMYLNPDSIVYMCDHDESGTTLLYLKERGQFQVADTKEEIFDRIRNINNQ